MCGAKATQSGGGIPRPVLVLTERPPDYESVLGFPWLEPLYESTVAGLLERLAAQPVSGFVLELDKVLHAPGPEREQLFQLSEPFRFCGCGARSRAAVLRIWITWSVSPFRCAPFPRVWRGMCPVCRCFCEQCCKRRGPGPADAAGGLPATFLDLSVCGGALCCDAELGPGEELGVRILDLADAVPLTALVCWSGWRGRDAKRRCVGVRFLNMSPSQAKELGERYLGSTPGV